MKDLFCRCPVWAIVVAPLLASHPDALANGNQPPTVELRGVTDGLTVMRSTGVAVTVEAHDPEGKLTNLDILIEGGSGFSSSSYNPHGTNTMVTSFPYTFNAGEHTFYAIAADAGGLRATSAVYHVTALIPPFHPVVTIEWQRTIGTTRENDMPASCQTSNGGYALGGWAGPPDGSLTAPSLGASDFVLVKLDAAGAQLWERRYGGTWLDAMLDMVATDDGFALGGYSESVPGGNKTTPHFGGGDFWLVRTDHNGNVLWDASFGGTDHEYLNAMDKAGDGGFILAGTTRSGTNGNKTTPTFGGTDGWVVRVDAQGQKMWDRTFGGTDEDAINSVRTTSDGGYILAGYSRSPAGSGNKTSSTFGALDVWIIRLSAAGDVVWQRSYGGSGTDTGRGIQQTRDGGLVFSATSSSPAGPMKRKPASDGSSDIWLVQLAADGTLLWERSYGGPGLDAAYSVHELPQGGFVVSGYSTSDVGGNKTSPSFGFGSSELWVVRVDEMGEKVWEQGFGGTGSDRHGRIQPTPDGGFLLTGQSDSQLGGAKTSPAYGVEDGWILKLGPEPSRLRIRPQSSQDILAHGIQLLASGPPGRMERLERTTDFRIWTTVRAVESTTSWQTIVDTETTPTDPCRFYRLIQVPTTTE